MTKRMKTISYHHTSVRVIVSVIVSLFILLHGRWNQVGEALVSPTFYVTLAVSFSTAYLLLTLVYFCTKILDRLFPWNGKFYVRLMLQILVGVVLPALLDLLFMYIYFEAIGSTMIGRGFLMFDYPIIILFLILINAYYVITHLLQKTDQGSVSDDMPNPDPSAKIFIHNGNLVLELDVRDDVLYCFRKGRLVTIYTQDGKSYYLNRSLSSILDMHHEAGLIQINRSTLINKKIAQGYERGLRRDTLQVIIRKEYADLPAIQNQTLLVVTKEHIAPFKNLFKR